MDDSLKHRTEEETKIEMKRIADEVSDGKISIGAAVLKVYTMGAEFGALAGLRVSDEIRKEREERDANAPPSAPLRVDVGDIVIFHDGDWGPRPAIVVRRDDQGQGTYKYAVSVFGYEQPIGIPGGIRTHGAFPFSGVSLISEPAPGCITRRRGP